MYCTKCGKELKEEWKSCPFCGEKFESKQSQVNNTKVINNTEDYDFTIGKTKITGKRILQILAIIMIVCFFCPLYMVSCSGTELFNLNGLDVAFGFEYMNEEIAGNIVFFVLLLVPMCILYSTFLKKEDAKSKEVRNIWRDHYYFIAYCSGAMVLYIWNFNANLNMRLEEVILEIVSLTALKIIILGGVISCFIGMYLSYLTEDKMKNGKELAKNSIIIKCIGKIILGSVIGFFIFLAIEVKLIDNEQLNMDSYVGTYGQNEIYDKVDENLWI